MALATVGVTACSTSHPAPTTTPQLTPCGLFTANLAQQLLGTSVRRLALTELLPANATAAERAQMNVAAAKSCVYVLEHGAAPSTAPNAPNASLGIVHGLFASKSQFIQANSHNGAQAVSGLGIAALVSPNVAPGGLLPRDQHGWSLEVMVDSDVSFALTTSNNAKRSELIAIGRGIASRF